MGSKLDLRDDEDVKKKLAEKNLTPISFDEGEQMAKDIGASKYWECSSLTQKNVEELFIDAVRIGLDLENVVKKDKKKKDCILY